MRPFRFALGGLVCACLLLSGLAGRIQAETIAVDLILSEPDSQNNRLDTTLTVYTLLGARSDTDTATVTGSITANLGVYFDRSTFDVADVNSLEFTGGSIKLSDMSFILNYGTFVGTIRASTTGIAARPSSPWGPGTVDQTYFNTADHSVLLNQGSVTAYGTGLLANLFEPVTVSFADEPIEASADAVGTVAVLLDRIEGSELVYRVNLILPVAYDESVPVADGVTASIAGGGVIAAAGEFRLPKWCRLRADLTGDCMVDLYDLIAFCEQWLTSSEAQTCPLSADLAGEDCFVDWQDFTVLAGEWLKQE